MRHTQVQLDSHPPSDGAIHVTPAGGHAARERMFDLDPQSAAQPRGRPRFFHARAARRDRLDGPWRIEVRRDPRRRLAQQAGEDDIERITRCCQS